jgi:hypothetical protein
VIGRTRLDGRVALKLTLLNPTVTLAEVEALLALITATAADIAPAIAPEVTA